MVRKSQRRIIPIYAEIKPQLEEAFKHAEEGAEFVITRYRHACQNIRTTFTKIVKRAGLEPWPKLFTILWSSAATDLIERFPAHVVHTWMGHSEAIAREHFRQVTDAHHERAATCMIAQQNAESSRKRV